MSSYTQEGRTLAVTTSLGADALLLLGFSGNEALARLFSFQLDMASEQAAIAPRDVVGTGISWTVSHVDKEPRHFHGIINRLTAGARSAKDLRSYRVEVVPGSGSCRGPPTAGSSRT